MKRLILLLLAGGCTLGRAGGSPEAHFPEIGLEPAMAVLAERLRTAERVEVYEGLPNLADKQQLENEKRSNDCRQFAGQWFYAKPQEAKVGLAPELQRMLLGRLFKPYRAKLCGFHADYAVVLTTGKKKLTLLFCFGCYDAEIISESDLFTADLNTVDFRLMTSLDKKFHGELRSLLGVYHQRPTPAPGSQAARPAARVSALFARFMM